MTISPWTALLLAPPALMAGEVAVRKVKFLSRFNIPAPVVGGLGVSIAVFTGHATGFFSARFEVATANPLWTWIVTTEPEWLASAPKNINLPFLVAFFSCIGLNASWSLLRAGGARLVTFLAVATALAVLQNLIGVGISRLMGLNPLLGLVCGSVTLTGGHSTALGFASALENAGLKSAAVTGVAAATFGLVAGGLIGGAVGGALVRRRNLQPTALPGVHLSLGHSEETGIRQDILALHRFGKPALTHFLILLLCLKAGAWVSYGLQSVGLTFPAAMGAMITGAALRNLHDLTGVKWIRAELVDVYASVMLGVFLTVAMMTLNLAELAHTAGPMLIILLVQVVATAVFAWLITFRFMGSDFDAAVIAGGHCGFGLGATSNAVASMKSLVDTYGPAPRAFLIVPVVGGFLVDFVNSLNITFFLNLCR